MTASPSVTACARSDLRRPAAPVPQAGHVHPGHPPDAGGRGTGQSGPGEPAGHLDARLVGQHPVALNAVFAAIQLLLDLGIAWRPTIKVGWEPQSCGPSAWFFG
ncbi:MAG: hypothetical protein ACLP5E_03970, partial [Streptosporangiaceae bacterium]